MNLSWPGPGPAQGGRTCLCVRLLPALMLLLARVPVRAEPRSLVYRMPDSYGCYDAGAQVKAATPRYFNTDRAGLKEKKPGHCAWLINDILDQYVTMMTAQDPEVVDTKTLHSKYKYDRHTVCEEYFEAGKQYATFCDVTCGFFPDKPLQWCARKIAQLSRRVEGPGAARKEAVCAQHFAPGKEFERQCDKHCGYGFCHPYRGPSAPCNQSEAYPYAITAFNGSTVFDALDATTGKPGLCAALLGTGHYTCERSFCADRTQCDFAHRCSGTCRFCAPPQAYAAERGKVLQCYRELTAAHSAMKEHCFSDGHMLCDSMDCQVLRHTMRRVLEQTCAQVDLQLLPEYETVSKRAAARLDKFCNPCADEWQGSAAAKASLCSSSIYGDKPGAGPRDGEEEEEEEEDEEDAAEDTDEFFDDDLEDDFDELFYDDI